jgi:hypothetical protein
VAFLRAPSLLLIGRAIYASIIALYFYFLNIDKRKEIIVLGFTP